MIDAPVSGGVGGAQAGTLTFMCGGTESAFGRAQPILDAMGKNIFHAGDAGAGQAAKVCNNLMLAIQMIAVSEGFALADKLNLDKQKLFDIASTATSQCWSMTSYCPVPGPVPTSPANRDYEAGFTVAMMLKDLKLAQEAAQTVDANTPLGAQATEIYDAFSAAGHERIGFFGNLQTHRRRLIGVAVSRPVSRAVRSACGSCHTGGCASPRSQTCCRTSCRGAHWAHRHRHVPGRPVPIHHRYSLWELNLSRSQPVSFPMTHANSGLRHDFLPVRTRPGGASVSKLYRSGLSAAQNESLPVLLKQGKTA